VCEEILNRVEVAVVIDSKYPRDDDEAHCRRASHAERFLFGQPPCENSIMGSEMEKLPDWEQLLAAERHLQYLIPGAVLVGGTAAAIHDGHRVSMDADHVVDDLRERFDEVLATLEAVAGWQTERIQRALPRA